MNNRTACEFDDEELRCGFLFVVNITQHMTNLNPKLRGKGKHAGIFSLM
jgi:hypothetical protein